MNTQEIDFKIFRDYIKEAKAQIRDSFNMRNHIYLYVSILILFTISYIAINATLDSNIRYYISMCLYSSIATIISLVITTIWQAGNKINDIEYLYKGIKPKENKVSKIVSLFNVLNCVFFLFAIFYYVKLILLIIKI